MDVEKTFTRLLFLPLQKVAVDYKTWSFTSSPCRNLSTTRVICVAICILMGVVGYKRLQKRNKLPPGPWALPLVGWIGDVKNIARTATKMQKKYGDIFTLKLGVHDFVFLTDFSLVREALNNKDLQGRTNFVTFKTVTYHKNIGLINSEGEPWQKGRKFAMRRLGSLGLGKSNMQQYIQHEASKLIEYFENLEGTPVVLGSVLNVAVLNVIWRLVANRRYDIDDPEINEFIELLDNMVTIFEGPINLLNVMPWLQHILPSFILRKLDLNSLQESTDKIYEFTKREIQRHIEKYDPNDPKDYIDHYLKQIEAEKDDPQSHFSDDKMDLQASIIDLFFAGSETTSSTLKWFLLFMAQNPQEQSIIREQLDNAVPRPLLPSLEDKDNLPYLQAAVYETLRLSSFVPQGLPHVATKDTTVGGYDIPKGTIVAPCLEVCHKNEKYWEKPTQFYPKHFLDSDGQLVIREHFSPFSVGARRCLGESLAKMELFLMCAMILQQFTVEKGPSFETNLHKRKRRSNLFNMPPDVDLILKKRED